MVSPGPSGVLEGRDAELATLASAFEQACAGHGRVVVLTGEAGMGKSTLLQSFAERALARDVQAVWGRAWEFADAPAYFPVWPCLAALGLESGEVASRAPFALWESVLGALSKAAREKPQLWLLEDLHAADLQTLDLLSFMAQPLRVLPVLVVVSARPQDPRLGERGQQRLLRLARDGVDLQLAPLTVGSVERLAARHWDSLSDAARREIVELCSGNPLFVVECARALKAGRKLQAQGVSPTIRQVVLERHVLLPDATRELLESAAVLGRDFTAALLGRMHGLLPARVVDAILPALRGGIVLERAPGSFSFSHVLVQGVVYESLSAERRGQLHGLAERALASLPDTPEVSLERARHALGGLSPATESETVALVERAGRLLEASGAFDRAHALYGRLREKADAHELTRPISGVELLHQSSVAQLAGRGGEGRSLALGVLEQARQGADWALFSAAALELGRTLRPGLIDPQLVDALREALRNVGDDASPLACRLLARLAAALQPAPDPLVPVAMAGDAIARARRLNDDATLCEVLDMAGSAYVEYAPTERSIETSEALLEIASARGDRTRVQRARARLAFDRARLGDFGAYENEVEAMLRESEVAPSAQARVRPLLMASLAAGNRGRLAESRSFTSEAQQLLSLIDEPGLLLTFRAHTSARAVMLHLDDELESHAAEVALMVKGVPEGDGVALSLRAWFYARLGRLDDARRDLATLGTKLAAWFGSFVNIIAESAAATLSTELCRACHDYLSPFSGLEGVGGHVSVSYDGPVDRLLGLLESALGDHAAAEPKLRAALALAETRGFRAWVAQGHYDLGWALERAGQAAAAQAHFREAASVAEQCEMAGLVRRAQRLAGGASTTVTAAAPSPAASIADSALSMTREGELYRLELGAWCARIRASRGAELLARLVEAPNQEIHVLALASDEGAATSESNAGDALDREALRQYRQRLGELDRLIAEAETNGDLGRLPKLQRERAAIEQELQRGLGLGGRARQAASTTERARVNVQRRLKDAVERVAEASPELGTWLARRVRTGTYCSFSLKS